MPFQHTSTRLHEAGLPSLAVQVDLVAGRLSVAGRLGRRSTHLLAAAVTTLLVAGPQQWHLDLAAVTAVDTASLRALGAAYRRAVRHDRRLIVHRPAPDVERALRRLCLDRHVLAPEPTTAPAA
ncbi:STAS domain-containing protein [Geodermatophilus sp. SYSU D01036]